MMSTRRRRTQSAASSANLQPLEMRTLFSMSAALAQLIYLNTPHNVSPYADANPSLIIPAGTVIPVDPEPLNPNLNYPYFPLPNETGGIENGSISTTISEIPLIPSSTYTVTVGPATYTGPAGAVNFPICGNVTLNGGTTIESGSITVANVNAPDSGSLTINSGTINNTNSTITDSGTLNLNAGGGILTIGTSTGVNISPIFANGTLILSSPPLQAGGTLTINGSNADVITEYGISGTYKLYTLDAGYFTSTTLLDAPANSSYTFGIINGNLTVITPSEPVPTDPIAAPTSITDNSDATTQITIPATL